MPFVVAEKCRKQERSRKMAGLGPFWLFKETVRDWAAVLSREIDKVGLGTILA